MYPAFINGMILSSFTYWTSNCNVYRYHNTIRNDDREQGTVIGTTTHPDGPVPAEYANLPEITWTWTKFPLRTKAIHSLQFGDTCLPLCAGLLCACVHTCLPDNKSRKNVDLAANTNR